MTTTPHLELTKDADGEMYSVERVNANSDKLDAYCYENRTRIAALEANKADTNALSTVAFSGAYADLAGKPTVDDTLDAESTNAVQNAAVAAGITAANCLLRGTQITATSDSHFNLFSLTSAQARYFGASAAAYLDNAPSDFITSSGGQIRVFENQGVNRLMMELTSNSISGSGIIWRCWYTAQGWGTWFKFTGEAVT